MGGYNLRESVNATYESLALASRNHEHLWVDNSILSWRGESGHSFDRHSSIADAFYTNGLRRLFSRDDSFVTTREMSDERRFAMTRMRGNGSVASLREEIYHLFELLEVRKRIIDAKEIPLYSDICEKIVQTGLCDALGMSYPDITLFGATIARISSGAPDALLTDDTGIIAGASSMQRQGVTIPVYSRIMPYGKTRLEAVRLSNDEMNYFLERQLKRDERMMC